MRTLHRYGLTVTLLLALVVPVGAQTATDTTTLSAAVATPSATIVNVASASAVAVGEILYVDTEAMRVSAISGTSITVSRGQEGTRGAVHNSGATVYVAPASAIRNASPPRGSCTRANEAYLPQIVPAAGEIWDCPSGAGVWVLLSGPAPAVVVPCFVGVLVTSNVDQTCFIADRPYYVTKIQEIHTTAESGGTLTLIVRRQQGTEAPASGDALNTAIDMVGAGAVAQTLKTATLTTTTSLLMLQTGDRIGLDFTDDVAGELAGVLVTVTLMPQ